MLPLPRRRVDPEVLRDRLRALASGAGRYPPSEEPDGSGLPVADVRAHEPESAGGRDPLSQPALRTSLRPVVLAVAATALVGWTIVHLTAGGSPSVLELAPGTPVPSVSGVLVDPSSSAASSGTGTGASGPAASAAPDVVVVQVVGQVRRPGLVSLPRGSRVADAIAASGGLARGGSSGALNLARVLVDGEQIAVSPDAVEAPGPSSSAGGAATAVVDLNTATGGDLDTLPGVGPVMAGRILDWRAAHGRFTSVDQLREVSGIGARTFERLKPHVTV